MVEEFCCFKLSKVSIKDIKNLESRKDVTRRFGNRKRILEVSFILKEKQKGDFIIVIAEVG